MLGTDQVLNQGRYRIISSFGQDGSGGIYEAYDTVSDKNVVLSESIGVVGKVASANQLDAINSAFADEAKILAEIRHESLVTVQDYFSEIDRQYLVLEPVTGYSLTKYLEPEVAKPSLTDVLSWAEQVLGALQYLHRRTPPVIHGDIRPENIKLTSGLKVKLLTTKISGGSGSSAMRAIGEKAQDSAFNYRPLEQIWPDLDPAMQKVILEGYDEKAAGLLMRPLDARSDIYSIGASFYHVLTGTLPGDALERSIAMLDGKPDPLARPADLDSGIPAEISDALMRAMSIRRENRFDWAVIMSQVLRTAIVRAKERQPELIRPPKEPTNKEIPVDNFPLPPKREPQFDHTSPEAQFEIRQQLVEDRQAELEAEHARIENERNRLERRRLELEAEKEQHAAERERLRVEAEEARQRAELDRKRLEKEKLEQAAENERQKIAVRLAELAAARELERVEEERIEKEAEAERQRAEQRLKELHAEQENRRAAQERIALEAKRELELAEKRLLELSGSHLDVSEPEVGPIENMPRKEVAPADDVTFLPTFDYESTVGERSGFNWRIPVAGGVALLIVGGVVGWMFMPANSPEPSSFVQPAAIMSQETKSPAIDPSPEPEKVTSHSETGTTPASVEADPAAPATDGQKRPQISAIPKKPAPEKAPAAKKKVTVDDLINDN